MQKTQYLGMLSRHAKLTSHLETFDHLFEILRVVTDTPQRHTFPALVEYPQRRRAACRPADHVLSGAVKHHSLGPLVQQDEEVIGDGQQGLQLPPRPVVLHLDEPGDGPQAAQLCSSIRPALLLFLVRQRDEGELSGGVDGSAGGVALGQVAQVLLSRSGGHGAELLRLVGGVFCIDDLGQQEVPEHGGFGKGHIFWDGRTE